MTGRIEELEQEIARLNKIIRVLMDRVEHTVNGQGNAFGIFEENILLQKRVEERTVELQATSERLKVLLDEQRSTNQQLELAMQQANDLALRAEVANIAKTEFLSNMSHEIRTPLNGIMGITELLQATPVSSEQRQYVDIIRSSGETLLGVLNNILEYSKVEAEKLEPVEVEFSTAKLMRCIAATLGPLAANRNLTLSFDIAPDIPDPIRGDATRLRQALINLIGNAIKFTDQGGVSVSVRLEAPPGPGPDITLRFTVQDSGIGIAPDKIESLFKSFSQVDGSMTRRHGGTGLGLAIVKQLVTQMRGQVGVTSEPGTGSVFWFTATLKRY